jgi:hypothetical protein
VNTERLLKLADHLDTVVPEQFNICSWAGCAAGHAVTIFRNEGLDLVYFGGNAYITYNNDSYLTPNTNSIAALEKFFSLTFEQVNIIFMPSSYNGKPTPQIVANRIRKVVEAGEVDYYIEEHEFYYVVRGIKNEIFQEEIDVLNFVGGRPCCKLT